MTLRTPTYAIYAPPTACRRNTPPRACIELAAAGDQSSCALHGGPDEKETRQHKGLRKKHKIRNSRPARREIAAAGWKFCIYYQAWPDRIFGLLCS